MAILDALGLLNPAQPGSSVTVADVSLTFRDGGTGRTQAVALGATALELGGGGTPLPLHMTVAAVTDKRDDPCEKDGSLSLREPAVR